MPPGSNVIGKADKTKDRLKQPKSYNKDVESYSEWHAYGIYRDAQ